jgi:NAD(P)H-dependent flavin oxidoreductase YrpB (nitropropane dioxygenase family)
MLRTRFCDLAGVDLPIVSAGMGPNISGPELVAAVSNAGGLGILQAQMARGPEFREEIRRVRALTSRPFGVNFVLRFPHDENVAICLEEGVRVLSFFWGERSPHIEKAHQAGAIVIHQVGSVAAAETAVRAGVDVIIAQGVEAGGHVAGETSTMALVPRVVDAVRDTPVLAAGGIADARGLVAALALGAEGVVMGTRFVASLESHAHPVYKQRLLETTEEETIRTVLFGIGWPNSPHRTIRTDFVQQWLGSEDQAQELTPDTPLIGESIVAGRVVPVPRFMGFPPSAETTGDIESMALMAGQSVGMVQEIQPAGEIVKEIAERAERLITMRLQSLVSGRGQMRGGGGAPPRE